MRSIIALGSNMGDRLDYLNKAKKQISLRVGKITGESKILETKAYGYTEQGDFLNMAISVETKLQPEELLDTLLEIESELGRVRTIHWGPRTLDLDIIYYGDKIIKTERLKVPHPDLHNREFVLKPVSEICPEFFDPLRKKQVSELLLDLRK
ncbi:MAG: 2-amino-4-hydroxy-6-hydroxymethyldihydropteridine diphosphokinase [Hornefia sp.]|nr:2-amino-4-hydroxy-6-hydroxymethyldihydropteridine diphosphokinase [Hornefia sp.]